MQLDVLRVRESYGKRLKVWTDFKCVWINVDAAWFSWSLAHSVMFLSQKIDSRGNYWPIKGSSTQKRSFCHHLPARLSFFSRYFEEHLEPNKPTDSVSQFCSNDNDDRMITFGWTITRQSRCRHLWGSWRWTLTPWCGGIDPWCLRCRSRSASWGRTIERWRSRWKTQ